MDIKFFIKTDLNGKVRNPRVQVRNPRVQVSGRYRNEHYSLEFFKDYLHTQPYKKNISGFIEYVFAKHKNSLNNYGDIKVKVEYEPSDLENDYNYIEILFSFLCKNPSIINLNLESNSICLKQLLQILNSLSQTKIIYLNLSNNNIDVEGLNNIINYLKNNYLKTLILSKNQFLEDSFMLLIENLDILKLKNLTIDCCWDPKIMYYFKGKINDPKTPYVYFSNLSKNKDIVLAQEIREIVKDINQINKDKELESKSKCKPTVL